METMYLVPFLRYSVSKNVVTLKPWVDVCTTLLWHKQQLP